MMLFALKHHLLLLALLFVPTLGQQRETVSPEEPDYESTLAKAADNVCLVCGQGGTIENTWRTIFTDFGMYTCGGLAGAGQHGNIPPEQCAVAMAAAVEKCGCIAADDTDDVPVDDPYFCNICSNDRVVTNPDGIVVIPSQPNRTCAEYLVAAADGAIQEDRCALVQQSTIEACGCVDADDIDIDRPDVGNETFVCPVCGEGMVAQAPNVVVSIPLQPDRTCAEFEEAAQEGLISEQQCALVKPFVQQNCRCGSEDPNGVVPTPSPIEFDCPICGTGNYVTLPDAVVVIPTQPNRTCSELLFANSVGNIHEHQCYLLQPFVQQFCGCMSADSRTPSPSPMPSMEPTRNREPTVSPAPTSWTTARPECFDDLSEIHDMEKDVDDVSVLRKYVLCPGTTFHLGVMDEAGQIGNGQKWLMLRPNVKYQCGEDGSRSNNCILKGGDFGLTSFYGVYDGIYETVDNVIVQGLTFQSQNLFAAVMQAAGDISFRDCAFKGHGNIVPVLIQWKGDGPQVPVEESRRLESGAESGPGQLLKESLMEDLPSDSDIEAELNARSLEESEFNHVVSFQDCVFRDNHVVDNTGFPGIIENSYGSEVRISNCLFQDNDYGKKVNPAPFGYAIRSFGPVFVDNSCFLDNVFHNHAPISVYGARQITSQNYVRSYQEDMMCEFVAVFASQDEMSSERPVCFDSDASSCPFSQPPTPSPTRGTPTSPPTTEEERQGSMASTIHGEILVGVLLSLILACIL